LIVLFPYFSVGQNNQWIEYQNKTWLQVDSSQITTANLTHATLKGCIDVVESYRTQKTYTDSLVPALKATNGSLRNQISIYQEVDNSKDQNIKFLEKSLKKEKRKVVGGKIITAIFVISSATLAVLYITK
jgi:hypothetical protein